MIPDELKRQAAQSFAAWDHLRQQPDTDPDELAAALERFFAVSAEISALRKPADEVLR